MMNAKTAVLGAGAWGTAAAKVLAEKGNQVDLRKSHGRRN
jgi:glycerol-3-phosphate dehydrogenase